MVNNWHLHNSVDYVNPKKGRGFLSLSQVGGGRGRIPPTPPRISAAERQIFLKFGT